MSNFGGFFPIDNTLYRIAFGTHTKTAELIEMPFGLMTRVGSRYHVLYGEPDPKRRGNFLGNVADHCKVMGHSTVRCAKTTEPIDMPFWMKIWVGSRNHVLDGGADSPRGRGNFGVVWAFKSINWQCSLQRSLQRRCKMDNSIANIVMQQK